MAGPERHSLSHGDEPADQAELVALTSMYGLPVIASKDTEVSSQIEPPSDDGKKYITDADPDPKSPYAIYMPVPLQARRLALGATDASGSGRAACGYRLLGRAPRSGREAPSDSACASTGNPRRFRCR